jgi:hypothetical protein
LQAVNREPWKIVTGWGARCWGLSGQSACGQKHPFRTQPRCKQQQQKQKLLIRKKQKTKEMDSIAQLEDSGS